MSFLLYRNRGNFGSILDTLKSLDLEFLAIAVVLYFIGISFIVFRWGTLLKAHDYHISRLFLWQSAFIGWFYNMLLPTGVGGDFYRVYDLHENKGVPINENISAVVIERIIGTFTGITLLIISFLLGIFAYLPKNIVIALLSAIGVTLGFFIIFFFPRFFRIDVILRKIRFFSKIRPKLREFHKILVSYRNKWKFVFIAYLYSLIIQTVFVTSYYFINLSIGMNITYGMMVFTLPFASIVTSLPIAIGGMGIRENATVFVLESFGASRVDATLFSFIVLSIILFNALIGGLVYILKNIFYKSKSII
jgi:glycosyltransferase 2 family protein